MADTPSVVYSSARITLAAAVAEKGIMIAINTSNGQGQVASDAATRRVIGITEETGAISDVITVYAGKFLFDNSSVYPVTKAYIGADVYVEDEHTVGVSAGSNSVVAGKCIDVVSAGVYVACGVQ